MAWQACRTHANKRNSVLKLGSTVACLAAQATHASNCFGKTVRRQFIVLPLHSGDQPENPNKHERAKGSSNQTWPERSAALMLFRSPTCVTVSVMVIVSVTVSVMVAVIVALVVSVIVAVVAVAVVMVSVIVIVTVLVIVSVIVVVIDIVLVSVMVIDVELVIVSETEVVIDTVVVVGSPPTPTMLPRGLTVRGPRRWRAPS